MTTKLTAHTIKINKNGITQYCQNQNPKFWSVDVDELDFDNNSDGTTTVFFTSTEGGQEFDVEITTQFIQE